MRFASSQASRPRLRELVAALDEDGVSIAETWRRVAESAAKLGLPRPSYPHLRRLIGEERRVRELRHDRNAVLKEAASTIGAGRVPGFDYTVGRLLDAQAALLAEEACVSEPQGISDPRQPRG